MLDKIHRLPVGSRGTNTEADLSLSPNSAFVTIMGHSRQKVRETLEWFATKSSNILPEAEVCSALDPSQASRPQLAPSLVDYTSPLVAVANE